MNNSKEIIYISSVDINESSGQGSFEKNFISHLTNKKVPVCFFTVNEAIPNVSSEAIYSFSLGTKKIANYFIQQWKMFWSLKKYLSKDKSNKIIFVRESALVIAPVLIAKLMGIPLVMRSGPGHVNLLHYNKTKSSLVLGLYKNYNRIMQRANDKIIVVTQGIKRTLMQEYNVQDEKIKVIPNPVNDDLFARSDAPQAVVIPNLKLTNFVFGYVGAVYFHQYVQDLIEATYLLYSRKKLPEDVKILIVGGGSYLEEIQILIKKYGLEDIVLTTGRFEQHEVDGYFEHCNCCVATYSKEFDKVKGSSALKIAEYLYFNKYILAADIQDYAYLENKGFGKLYATENPEDMAKKMLEIYENRNNLKISSRDFVRKERTAEVIFDKYLQEIYGTTR